VVTDPHTHTHTHTHTQTHRQDRLQYTAPQLASAQCNKVSANELCIKHSPDNADSDYYTAR